MLIKTKDLKDFCVSILNRVGLSGKESSLVADSLVAADMRGIRSHGVTRLRAYSRRIESGVICAGVIPEVLNDSPTALLIDGKNGMGVPVGIHVIESCIEKAKNYGSCFAAVSNANHFGIGAYFTMFAAQHGMISIAMSNAPASMVPVGGRKPMLGTNPLSIAIPAGEYPPLVLDMASSVVAQGKIILASKQGVTRIPDSWAVDENGMPTSDPREALKGAMLPFGGPKGYAIAFIIDILCSALSGAFSSTGINSFWDDLKNPQGLGYFMGVWNIEHFISLELFKQRVDELFYDMKASPTAEGVNEVFIPGELEFRNSENAENNGIELSEAVYTDLKALACKYEVDFFE